MSRPSIEKIVALQIDGSIQRICLRAERPGLPPILIVQAGPGLPLRNEVAKFRRHLHLESDFLVCYWDQRGCGNVSAHDAGSVSLQRQVADLHAVLQWLHNETKQKVIVFGISLGATISLQAAENQSDKVKSVIAVSADADTSASDAAANTFLQERSALSNNKRIAARLKKLGEPPYTEPASFQLRGRLLADFGGIERTKRFGVILGETLFGMIGAYGLVGTAKALRNMNLVQRALLPQLVALDLFANPPRLGVSVHYLFGERDPLTTLAIARQLPLAIPAPAITSALVPDAGHMVHFDKPEVVRSVVMKARNDFQG
jgi:pimeloyl-ACP methyl ester carboxylesterase